MNFTKMQAAGNDFVVIDARGKNMEWPSLAITMCDRHFGAGADGIIIVNGSDSADLRMRIFNADGTEAEACGNGLRSFARFVLDKGLTRANPLTVETMAGIRKIEAFYENDKVKRVKTSMGKPALEAEKIPVILDAADQGRGGLDIKSPIEQSVIAGGITVSVALVSMGNPHAVAFIDEDVNHYNLNEIGPLIERHKIFPRRTNFEIANVVNHGTIKARVWERGVGETLACGSGACAVAVAGILKGLTGTPVDIMLPGGTLTIEWDGKGEVYLTGPAEPVYEGIWPD